MVQINQSYVMFPRSFPSRDFCLFFCFCKSAGAGAHRHESSLFSSELTTLLLKSVQFSSMNRNRVKIKFGPVNCTSIKVLR